MAPIWETTPLTCEQLCDGLVLSAGGADEQQPGGKELVVTGQELGDGPGRSRGRALFPFFQLEAFIDGVYQQEEGLLGRFDAQQRQEDAPEQSNERVIFYFAIYLPPVWRPQAGYF